MIIKPIPVSNVVPPPAVEPAEQRPAVPEPPVEIDRHEVDSAVDKMNETARALDRSLQFKVVEENRIIIKVVDAQTGDVVREIPPEDLIRALRHMEEALGVLLDRKL